MRNDGMGPFSKLSLGALDILANAVRSVEMSQYIHRKKKQNAGKGRGRLLLKVRSGFRLIIDFMSCVYLVLMIVGMPLYFRDGYSYIATDKAFFCQRVNINVFRVLIPVYIAYLGSSLAAFLWERRGKLTRGMWLEQLRKVWGQVTLPDIFMGVYGAALTVSYLCSDYKESALWGMGNGWYIGFLPQIMLVGMYFFIAKFWKPRRSFFYLLFVVSGAVFLLGYLNCFGIYPIEMKLSRPDFISTIGNINWYCGYAVTVFFAGVALIWKEDSRKGRAEDQKESGESWKGHAESREESGESRKGHAESWKEHGESRKGHAESWKKRGKVCLRVLLCGYVLLGFATLMTQGSTSGIVTLAVMLLVLLAMSAGNSERMRNFWLAAVLLSVACLFTGIFRSAVPEGVDREDKLSYFMTTGGFPMAAAGASLLLFVFFCIIDRKGLYPQKVMKIIVLAIVALASSGFVLYVAMLVINTKNPGSLGQLSEYPVFTFSDSWGSNRGATWKAGIRCFAEQEPLHKLAGVGPDAMAVYLDRDSSEGLREMLNRAFGDLKLTNAHNEWLTVLVNTGILGLAGFGGAMVTAVGTLTGKSGKEKSGCSSICFASGLALLAYTINNIFSFQQTVSLTTMIVILGMGMAFWREEIS